MIQDYHFHTSFSDGTLTTDNFEIFCLKNNLTEIVVSDHHNYDFFNEFNTNKRAVKVHTGMEIDVRSSMIPNLQLILYDFDPNNEDVKKFVSHVKKCRQIECFKLYKKLKENKIFIDKNYFFSPQTSYIDIVKIVQKKKNYQSLSQTVIDFFEKEKPFFIETFKPDLSEVLYLKELSKGKLFLPHPNRFIKYSSYEKIFSYCRSHSISGVECYHPEISLDETEQLKMLCDKFGLKVYYGSDYHCGEYVNKFMEGKNGNSKTNVSSYS